MTTTNLLAVRMPNGRLFHASYRDEKEKARIEAWARANNAQVDTAAEQTSQQALIHLA